MTLTHWELIKCFNAALKYPADIPVTIFSLGKIAEPHIACLADHVHDTDSEWREGQRWLPASFLPQVPLHVRQG